MSERKLASTRCSEDVSGQGSWGAFHSHQCRRKGVVTIEGKLYCKQHNPVVRKAERDAKYAAELAESEKRQAAAATSKKDAQVGRQLRETNPALYSDLLQYSNALREVQ